MDTTTLIFTALAVVFWIRFGCSLQLLGTKLTGLYMIRFRLLKTVLLGTYVHRFVQSDSQHLHDHPWHSIGIVLMGQYEETYVVDGEMRSRFSRLFIPRFRHALVKHRVTLVKKPVWTLFIPIWRHREWGFYTDPFDNNSFIHWKDYTAIEDAFGDGSAPAHWYDERGKPDVGRAYRHLTAVVEAGEKQKRGFEWNPKFSVIRGIRGEQQEE